MRPRKRRALNDRANDVATAALTLGDLSVRVLSIDEVIASKEELARPKDTAALSALYATREALRQRRARQSPR